MFPREQLCQDLSMIQLAIRSYLGGLLSVVGFERFSTLSKSWAIIRLSALPKERFL